MAEPWIKLQRNLTRHPRAAEAGASAMWLYIGGLSYCDEFATDGRIPSTSLFGLTNTHARPEREAALLVKVGLWSKDGDTYVVERYLEKNRSAAEIAELKERASRAGKKSAAQRSVNQTPNQPLNSPLNQPLNAELTQPPTVKERDKEQEKAKTKKLKSVPAEHDAPTFEEFWAEYPPQQNGSKPEKKLAHDQWQRLKPDERQRAFDSLKHYKTHLKQTEQFSKHAFRYLRDRSFEDRLTSAGANGTPHDPEAEARRLVASAGL